MNKFIALLLSINFVDAKRLVQLRNDENDPTLSIEHQQKDGIEGTSAEENGSECLKCKKGSTNGWGKSWNKKKDNSWKIWEDDEEEDCECNFIEGDVCDFEPDVDDCILEDIIAEPGIGQGDITTI